MSSPNAGRAVAPDRFTWLKRSEARRSAAVRLLCFPFAGAGANAYRSWPRHLDHRIELIAVQMPGRESRLREPHVGSAGEVTAAVADELMRLCPHQPLAVFGHSMGSLLAYDLAIHLKHRHDWEPCALIVSGRLPPNVKFGGDLHAQPDPVLIAEIKRLNGTPAAILEDEEMRRLVLPIVRSDYRIVETYRATHVGSLDCPMVVCTSSDDPGAPPQEMIQWRSLSSGPFSRWSFPGDHFFLRDQAAELGASLNRFLMPLVGCPEGDLP